MIPPFSAVSVTLVLFLMSTIRSSPASTVSPVAVSVNVVVNVSVVVPPATLAAETEFAYRPIHDWQMGEHEKAREIWREGDKIDAENKSLKKKFQLCSI